MLALYLWQLDRLAFHLLILVVNGWLQGLFFIVTLHVTVWIIVSWDIHNWWALSQFSTDLISPCLFFLFESRCPIDLHLVDIGVTASFCSGFRDCSVTVPMVLRLFIVWAHALATSRNVRPAVFLPWESFFPLPSPSYNTSKSLIELPKFIYLHGESIDSWSIALAMFFIFSIFVLGWLVMAPILWACESTELFLSNPSFPLYLLLGSLSVSENRFLLMRMVFRRSCRSASSSSLLRSSGKNFLESASTMGKARI